MITSLCLAILLFTTTITCGFVILNKINKINSLICLIPFSVSFGISLYIFVCHVLSFLVGPQKSSVATLFILLLLSVFILVFPSRNKTTLPPFEISKKQFAIITAFSLIIMICTFLSLYRYGLFDEAWHIPLAVSIYHNDIYPPRDFLRPDYVLLYHFGGDLLAGAINHFCKIDIFDSFALQSSIFSGITFLSYFALAWLLTKKYGLSLITSFCCYFGGGFTWLSAILNYINHPSDGFWNIFLKKGIRSIFLDPPSLSSFSSTSSIGYPVLILCLFLFWNLTNETLNMNRFKINFNNILTLLIALFSLTLFAGWLSITFIASVFVYWIINLFIKKKQYLTSSVNILTLFGLFFLANKLLGNQMYSATEYLGRAKIFNIAPKEHPLTITIWSGLSYGEELTTIISCLSTQFIFAFGLSLFLLPLVFIYLIKYRNKMALLLFLCAAVTMPLPLILEFKLNPVDFNRLFGFGNTMLILLITCGLGLMFCMFIKNKIITITYLLCLCLSPFSGFILGTVFSPQIYLHKNFTALVLNKLTNIHSINNLVHEYIEINKDAVNAKNAFRNKYKNELAFFNDHGKPKDVAISSIPRIPIFSGIYTLIPSMIYGLKGQIYSGFDNIYPTIISTLDPHLMKELNVKWVAYDEISKSKLLKETLTLLNNKKIFQLVYKNYIFPEPNTKVLYEIYHVKELSRYLKDIPKNTGWILVNREGFPVEITDKLNRNISLFSSEKNTLQYLKQLQAKNPRISNELITAQPILIKTTQEQLLQNGLTILLEEKH